MRIGLLIKIVCICALGGIVFLAGCERECSPQIVGEVHLVAPSHESEVARTDAIEDINKTAKKLGVPVEWIPPSDKKHCWFAIVVHHTATEKDSAACIDKEHKGRLDDFGEPWIGIGYDFVIGNGTLSGDGEVEPTFRWKQQLVGAHCKTGDNWANTYAIGIALVGNFDQSRPSAKQMESLIKLVGYLQKQYDIPIDDIYGHGSTPGGHATDCPGKNFPMWQLKQQLSNQIVASHNKMPQDLND